MWLARRVPQLSREQARLEVRIAELLDDADQIREALGAGAFTVGHVEHLVRVRNPRTRIDFGRDESLLVTLAADLDVDAFETAARHWKLHADPTGTPPDDPTHNTVSLSPVGGRFRLSGDLDGETGSTLKAALEEQISRRLRAESADETSAMTPGRRRAAALVDLVEAGAASREVGGNPSRPSFVVRCELSDLTDDAVGLDQVIAVTTMGGDLTSAPSSG